MAAVGNGIGKDNNTIRIGTSFLERGSIQHSSSKHKRYVDTLRKLDKNGDNELDMEEICDAIDVIVDQERENRMLKWFVIILAIISICTVAATVGLVIVVVDQSKDTSVSSNSVLTAKGSGEALQTATYLTTQNATLNFFLRSQNLLLFHHQRHLPGNYYNTQMHQS
jgi:hypothetical protein